MAKLRPRQWQDLYSLAEAAGERVRLDWEQEPPPSLLNDSRFTAD